MTRRRTTRAIVVVIVVVRSHRRSLRLPWHRISFHVAVGAVHDHVGPELFEIARDHEDHREEPRDRQRQGHLDGEIGHLFIFGHLFMDTCKNSAVLIYRAAKQLES